MNFIFGSSLNFAYPFYLYFLLLIPFFVVIYFVGLRYSKKNSIGFPNFEALQRTGIVNIHSKNIFYLYIFILILFFLVIALVGTNLILITSSGDYSYVVAIDNSNSMRASDIAPNRLEVSKTAAKDFVNNLPMGVKTGIISFSGDVKIISPLDSSKLLSLNSIDKIELSDIGGTNLRDAVFTGEEILKKEKSKVIIILSDGQINLGNFSEIVDYAKLNKIRINTIVIGTSEGGDTGYGFISKTDIDALKSLAFNTEGKSFVVDSRDKLDLSFDELINNSPGKLEINISAYSLIIVLILISFFWFSYNFRFKTFP